MPKDDEDPFLEEALRVTAVMESIFQVYKEVDNQISMEMGLEIAFSIACEKAFGAATHPEDALQSFKEAMA